MNAGLESFSNEGTINGDLALTTKAFSNSGEINLLSNGAGTLIAGQTDTDLSFTNTGSIILSDNGAHLNQLLDHAITLVSGPATTNPADITVLNDTGATIEGGISVSGFAKDFSFTNKGVISIPSSNPNFIDRAVDLDIGQSDIGYAVTNIEEIAADSVLIDNSGTLDGGMDGRFTTVAMNFVNSGTINNDVNDDEAEALRIETNDYGSTDSTDGGTFTFTNTGQIEGTASFDLETTSVTVTNSGDITRDPLTYVPQWFPTGFRGLEIDQETALDADLTLVNTGTISTSDRAGGALAVSMEAGDIQSGLPGAATANATASITNSGSIISRGGVYVTQGDSIGLPQGAFLVHLGYGIGAGLDAEGTSSLTIHNQTSGIIRSEVVPPSLRSARLLPGPRKLVGWPWRRRDRRSHHHHQRRRDYRSGRGGFPRPEQSQPVRRWSELARRQRGRRRDRRRDRHAVLARHADQLGHRHDQRRHRPASGG
ncbi:hypothetical protein ACFSTD_17540 [Novosphingobium colocasiae]